VEDYCYDDKAVIRALGFGGNKTYAYNWNGLGFGYSDSLILCLDKDTTISVVISDLDPSNPEKLNTIPDTAWLDIKVAGGSCVCNKDSLDYELTTSGGSDRYYCGGFEIILGKYEDLAFADHIITQHLSHKYQFLLYPNHQCSLLCHRTSHLQGVCTASLVRGYLIDQLCRRYGMSGSSFLFADPQWRLEMIKHGYFGWRHQLLIIKCFLIY